SIEISAPGKFGLYGYLEEMAVAFSNNEKMDELSNVYLFIGCISNALGYMKNRLPAYAKAQNLDDAVTEVIASKIADAAKYYDNASKVFAEFVAKLPKKEPKEEKVSDAEQSLKMLSSLSLYETSRFVCDKDYDYVDSILSQINLNSLKDDKDAVFTFEKLIILSNINYGERFASALCKCLKENNAFDSNGNVSKYVGMTGYKYDELKNASLRTFKDPSQIKDYIIETDDLIASISYMLSTFNYINEHYVFLADYRGMEKKLGNPHDSYIRMLIKYYSKLYADFVNVYNRLLTQYLSDMKQDADGVYNKYKAIVSREAAIAKSKCFERESAKKAAAKAKTTASSVSKPKPPAPKKMSADEEKKLRSLSPSQAYKMADDPSVTDKQRNEYIDNLTTYAVNESYITTSVDLCEKAILIGRKSRYKYDTSIKTLVNKLKSANAISADNKLRGSFTGTLGNSLASCANASGKSEYVGSSTRYTTSALSIVLCVIFIGYIWLVNYENVQWLGTANMTKLLILAGLGIICGVFTGGKNIVANLVSTGVVFIAGA
ncbi:MAG: hypothetical protein IKU13_01665, partial [Clostridia bacterium]|nr:hypothetical protein [Clostridia bacterium]